jgi:hypothetical protein
MNNSNQLEVRTIPESPLLEPFLKASSHTPFLNALSPALPEGAIPKPRVLYSGARDLTMYLSNCLAMEKLILF